MKFNDYLKTFAGSQSEVRYSRLIHAMLATAIVILVLQSFMRDAIVVLTPPGLDKVAQVSRDKASKDYMESWGLYMANILGNVHPGNADFIKTAIGPMLSTDIYQNVMDVIQTQVEDIKRDRVSQRFEPRAVEYEAESGKVFVDGYAIVSGPSGGDDRQIRTYEMKFDIKNYRIVIKDVRTYKGQPLTQKALERKQRKDETRGERQ